jgi:hypothetical protein
MTNPRRFPRVWPGEFRHNFGNYLAEISLSHKSFVLYKKRKRMCVFTPLEPGATGEGITPSQYRQNSGDYIAQVRWGTNKRFIITKRGRKLAWMRPVEDLEIPTAAPRPRKKRRGSD